MGGDARRRNLGQQGFAHGIRGDFVADDDDAGDVGLFGPTGGDLTMDQAIVDTREANHHVVIRTHRFGRCSGFRRRGWSGRRGRFFHRFGLQRFHAFAAGLYR